MRFLSKILASTALLGFIGAVNGAIGIQSTDIDLHQQRIGMWNIEEKVAPALSASTEVEKFSVDLSDNTLMDEDILTLLGMIESRGLTTRLKTLNLSNNRLSLEGVKALIPLLRSSQLQCVNVSINNLMVDDFQKLWEAIEREAHRVSIIEETDSPETLRDDWASKIVLLPSNYNTERFPLPVPFIIAHKKYYQAR